MSRSFGATWFTTRLPIAISPSVISSSPAIIRSRVDLPQPDGPTSTQNSPSSILMSTPCTTSVVPKDFLTLERVTEAMVFSSGLCGDRQAGGPDRFEGLVGEDELLVAERFRLRRRAALDRERELVDLAPHLVE